MSSAGLKFQKIITMVAVILMILACSQTAPAVEEPEIEPTATVTEEVIDPLAEEISRLVEQIDPENFETFGIPEEIVELGRPAVP